MTTTLFFGIVNDVWFSFNIIEKIQYTYSTLPVEELTDGTRFSYNYPTSGWKDQLLKFNNENFVYDNLGNPTTYRDKTLTWKYGRQLASFENITYKYNADGIRISKTNADNITTHFYLDGTKILAQDNGNLLTFKYGIDGVIGFTYQGVGDFYYKKNIFGDIIGIIDKNGQEIAKYTYDAWGNHKSYALNNGSFVDISLETSYTQDGLNNKLITELNPFRYRGYYYDIETHLYYLNSRYYDPEIGRFINADEIAILDESKNYFNGLNLYSYCINNPIMYLDFSGKSLIALFLFLIGATIAGAVLGGEVAYNNGARGWDLAKNIILGGAFGLATGGAIVAGFAVFAGAIGFTTILGVSVAQMFAIGALAFNFTAYIIAPLFGIDMQGIEFEDPNKYSQYQPPEYIYSTSILNNLTLSIQFIYIRRNKNDKILWRNIRKQQTISYKKRI